MAKPAFIVHEKVVVNCCLVLFESFWLRFPYATVSEGVPGLRLGDDEGSAIHFHV